MLRKYTGRLQICHVDELSLLLETSSKDSVNRTLGRKHTMMDGEPGHKPTDRYHTTMTDVVSNAKDVVNAEGADVGQCLGSSLSMEHGIDEIDLALAHSSHRLTAREDSEGKSTLDVAEYGMTDLTGFVGPSGTTNQLTREVVEARVISLIRLLCCLRIVGEPHDVVEVH